MERIFERSGFLRDASTNIVLGHCAIGSSLSSVLSGPISRDVLNIFDNERYILWFDHRCLYSVPGRSALGVKGFLRLHICLKEGYTPLDQLKAWVHAIEVGTAYKKPPVSLQGDEDLAAALLRTAYQEVDRLFSTFVERLRDGRWDIDAGAMLTGTPRSILMSVREGDEAPPGELELEARKDL